MRLTIFTVEEANSLLADIRPRLQRLMETKHEFDELQTRVEIMTLATAGAAADNPDVAELRRFSERRKLLAEQLSAGVNAVHRRGALIKDLDKGLLDFYAVSGDRLIFLCWQMGEPEVSHWHTIEGGFAQRQKLNHTELE